jgi:NitT/TauT family transport system substrate-binding protein
VAREADEDFSWEKLKGKNVLGGRDGGMPEMVFEYILKKNGIDPETDLSIDKSIDFGSTAAAFSGGQGDYSVEFEPGATALETEGAGYVVASLGVDSGYVPYTAFSAKDSYIKENPEIIRSFVAALKQGMEYTDTHTPAEIAEVIAPQFSDTDTDTMATIIERYKNQDTWNSSLIFQEESYELLLDILDEAGQLTDRPAYEMLVTTDYVD